MTSILRSAQVKPFRLTDGFIFTACTPAPPQHVLVQIPQYFSDTAERVKTNAAIGLPTMQVESFYDGSPVGPRQTSSLCNGACCRGCATTKQMAVDLRKTMWVRNTF